jgi:hypothetical protein
MGKNKEYGTMRTIYKDIRSAQFATPVTNRYNGKLQRDIVAHVSDLSMQSQAW